MIKVKVSREGSTYFRLSWDPPEYKPFYYQQLTSCRLSCESHPYVNSQMELKGEATSNTLYRLNPGSVCEITFLAVYNNASIDPGIKLIANTKSKSKGLFLKSKWIEL